MLKKLLYLFLGLVLAANISMAQITNYKFSANTGGASAFVPIVGGTVLNTQYNGSPDSDDGYVNGAPIGFTFKYDGINYTTYNVCTNGFISFGAALGNTANWTNNITSSTAVTRPILAPYWDDLLINGTVSYVLTGTAPLRVLTVQWLNAGQYTGGSTISFQVKLYETSNIIEYVYRQEAGAPDAGVGATIGISAVGTGTGNFLSLSTATNAAAVSSTTETTTLLRPATGQIFRFDPVYCAARGLFLSGGEKISNVTFANFNNSSTSVAEYENFTTVVTGATPGNTYPLSVSLVNSYSGDRTYVWFDFNANGSFADAGELVYTGTGAGPFSSTVTIPAGATLGYTRMRVRLDDSGGAPSNNTPCGDAEWGQVEDYTILIQLCATSAGTVSPAIQTLCTGDASFTSNAVGTGITQQWQVSSNGGATWSDLTNAAPYAGVTTATLSISPVSAGLNGNQYRVSLGGTCTPANTFTNAGTLKTLAIAPTIAPATPSVCLGTTQNWTVTAPAGVGTPVNTTVNSGAITVNVPDATATGITNPLTVTGIPAGAIINSISVNINLTHTWDSDMTFNLVAPNGQSLNLINRRGGSGDNFINTTISSTGVLSLATASAPFTNTYAADAAIGAGATTNPSTAASFAALYSVPNGTYLLAMRDHVGGDFGILTNWSITINYSPIAPQPVVFAPTTNLFTDAAATVAYTGTPTNSIYYKPTAAGSFSYTASYTAAPCVSEVKTLNVTVNTPVSITTQPVNAAACTVQGTATFTVVAAGTGPLTYQWQVDNGTGFANIANGGSIAGATTATLTLTNIPQSWNGFKYRCNVTGVAPCGALATNGAATLTVNPLPTITLSASPYKKLFPGLVTNVSASSTPAAATHTWFYNGGLISGVTGNTVSGIDVDRMGDYSVKVTDINGCISTSGIVSITDSITGKVFIYPSPNKGQFQVRYYSVVGNEVPRALTVFDAKGSKVFTQVYSVNKPYAKMDVDLRNIGAGIYWVELSDRNGKRLATGRVVVLR